MNEVGELFELAINHWRNKAGIGTALIPAPLNDKVIILGILQRIYERSPTCKTIIVVSNFQERIEIIECLTQQGDEENDNEFKKLIKDNYIKVFTYDFLKRNYCIMSPFLSIVYHPDTIDKTVEKLLTSSKFKLTVINRLFKDNNDTLRLYKICPLLDVFKQAEVEEARLSTPVEEIQLGVTIDKNSDVYKLLNYYNEYITTTLNIFGSFDIIQQARLGNTQLNISASMICAQIAQENGWNDHLDMSVEFNRKVDELYNPMALRDRASQTYEIIRNRSQLLSDYNGKLEIINNIVTENADKKILIINKKAEFASTVTDYLNNLSDTIICGNYHDKVENVPAVDKNGKPIYYKSGAKKGERRMMAAQAQKSYNESAFNRGELRVLSTNNAPDKSLSIDVDIIIITSSQCESIKSYMYRLDNLGYINNRLRLYTIYCTNSAEEKLLENRQSANNHILLTNNKNDNNNENNFDFIIAD